MAKIIAATGIETENKRFLVFSINGHRLHIRDLKESTGYTILCDSIIELTTLCGYSDEAWVAFLSNPVNNAISKQR